MYNKKYLLPKILIVFINVMSVNSYFNMSMYFKMPQLYVYDDYDHCLLESPSKLSVYCMVLTEVIPVNSSELWKQIEDFSQDKNRHFNHGSLFRGVCVNWCEEIVKNLNSVEKTKFYHGKLSNDQINFHIKSIWPKDESYRIRYNEIVNQCLNYNFNKTYGLMMRSNIEYCLTNKDTKEIDNLDIAFIITGLLIVILTTASTFYDFFLKKKLPVVQQTNQHYKNSVKRFDQSIFVSFSVCRNYFRITRQSYESSKFGRDFRFLDTFRFFMMLGSVAVHCAMFRIIGGIKNTEYIENFLHTFHKIILLNGSGLMLCYFTISGFLLLVSFDGMISKIKKEKRRYLPIFFKLVFLRYLRTVPLSAFVILLHASIFSKLFDGPIWRITEREKIFCQNNWWTNLLNINNYVEVEHSCLPQTWYLAVDFQLFVLSLIIMIFIYKYPRATKLIFVISFILAFLGQAVVVAKYNFPGIYFHTPEYFRYLVFINDDFKYSYIPSHSNMGGYLSGLLFGKIFLKLRSANYNLSKNKSFILFWYIQIIAGFLFIFCGEIFYVFKVPAILSGIYAGLFKILYPLLFGVIIMGMTDKIGWIGYEFSSLPIFRTLGRLSFSVMVTQVTILYLMTETVYVPDHVDMISLIMEIISKLVVTYFAAFILTILIELPVSALLKIIFMNKSHKLIEAERKEEQEVPLKVEINTQI